MTNFICVVYNSDTKFFKSYHFEDLESAIVKMLKTASMDAFLLPCVIDVTPNPATILVPTSELFDKYSYLLNLDDN